eukprot:1196058-Prorocentrum_minimum.AAC.9
MGRLTPKDTPPGGCGTHRDAGSVVFQGVAPQATSLKIALGEVYTSAPPPCAPTPTYPHTHIPTYPHTRIPAYPHTRIPAYPHTRTFRAPLDQPRWSQYGRCCVNKVIAARNAEEDNKTRPGPGDHS